MLGEEIVRFDLSDVEGTGLETSLHAIIRRGAHLARHLHDLVARLARLVAPVHDRVLERHLVVLPRLRSERLVVALPAKAVLFFRGAGRLAEFAYLVQFGLGSWAALGTLMRVEVGVTLVWRVSFGSFKGRRGLRVTRDAEVICLLLLAALQVCARLPLPLLSLA